tara:strand:+ start:105 stop:227 length:123 start_codon:yes stop_codon:yes gene_type:complete
MKAKYWQFAEKTNRRLAMMGLFALVVNCYFFSFIIPDFSY